MNEEKAQELYERFLHIQQHAQELEHHFQGMQEQLRNIEKTKDTITQLQQLTGPTQTWVPIAPGAYVKATIEPTDTVLLNVGAAAAVEKTPQAVIDTLEEHRKVLEELSEGAVQELKEAHEELEKIKQQVEREE